MQAMFRFMPDDAVTNDWRERVAAFLVTAVVFVAILWPERHYVPIWDGSVYANCAIDAAANGLAGLTMESLRCGGHPSQGYIVFLAASQVLRFGDIVALQLTNVVLGLLALASIRVALARVFPAPQLARQLDAVTFLCAVQPVLLATLLHVNVDFGVYVFAFVTLAALLSERFWLAALAGVLLCFSKEPGVLAFALMVGLDVVFRAASPGTVAERVRRVRPLWVMVIPVALFGAHVLRWDATHVKPAVWKHAWQQSAMDGFRFFDLSEPRFRSYAAGIFVLGFMWVISGLIAADLLVGGVRMVRRLPDRAVSGAAPARLAYLGVFTLLLTYLLTSFRTWSNLRYFALLYPLLVILSFGSLLRLGAGPRVRAAALAAIGALFLLATYRSVDPLSRAIYGTFNIGQRDMYRMSSFTGVFGGIGRDELVYNLQFTSFHWAQNAMYAAVKPTDSTTIVFPRSNRWQLWSPLDARTFERVAARTGTIMPDYADEAIIAVRARRDATRTLARAAAQRQRHACLAAASSTRLRRRGLRAIHGSRSHDHRASSGTA